MAWWSPDDARLTRRLALPPKGSISSALLRDAGFLFLAEDYHQQYFEKQRGAMFGIR